MNDIYEEVETAFRLRERDELTTEELLVRVGSVIPDPALREEAYEHIVETFGP